MGIRSLVTKLWFAIPIEIVDGEEFKIMYEVWVRDCEWQLYIGAVEIRKFHSASTKNTSLDITFVS